MEQKLNATDTSFKSPETFERHWQQLRGQMRGWWDRLTEADLEKVAGQKAQLIRLVQEKYGYAWECAEQEVDHRIREHREMMGASASDRQPEATASMAAASASRLAETAAEVGTKVQGIATAAATSVAGTVGRTGTYLQDLPADVMSLIRRHPIPSLLVGVGVGFLLARSLGQMQDYEHTHDLERETGIP
jgi:uncharacterized protein YjbJ (UPF0337 family)